MRIKATLDRGQVIFDQPIKFRRHSLPILITVADDEVIADNNKLIELSLSPETSRLINKMREIRGEERQYLDNGKTDKERFADELEAVGKYK
jgi:hypothetical protein